MKRILNAPFIIVVLVYQKTLGLFMGGQCRFYPSCSNYALDCLRHFWLPEALIKIVVRLAKCQPWHPGGVDLAIPENKKQSPEHCCEHAMDPQIKKNHNIHGAA